MRNITVTINDDVYRQARIWAAEHDTSVSAVVGHLLQTLQNIPRAARRFPAPLPPLPKPTSQPPGLAADVASTPL